MSACLVSDTCIGNYILSAAITDKRLKICAKILLANMHLFYITVAYPLFRRLDSSYPSQNNSDTYIYEA